MTSLFTPKPPLADRLRPKSLNDYIGQTHLLGQTGPIGKQLATKQLQSVIFWGPPGIGKTSLAKLIARLLEVEFLALNAVTAGISDIKKAVAQAQSNQSVGRKTILFVDEVHRFNKTQQDALLPYVENGVVIFIGATTENPSFHVIAGLNSRCAVYELKPLSLQEQSIILQTALKALNKTTLSKDISDYLIQLSQGDARKLINKVELLNTLYTDFSGLKLEDVKAQFLQQGFGYSEQDHYDFISAYIKSMRAGDVDGALYWLARMLAGGEDPRFIARRMVIFASEDIGIANSQALPLANACALAATTIGMPEIRINLSHVTVYLSKSKKSRQCYEAIGRAMQYLEKGNIHSPPNRLLNREHDAAYEGSVLGNDVRFFETRPDD